MNLKEFQSSLSENQPPSHLSIQLKALWYDGKGNWDRAHDLADSEHSAEGNWVHAFLHRKEGDKWNANYWYQKVGRNMPDYSLEKEWEEIVETLLERA